MTSNYKPQLQKIPQKFCLKCHKSISSMFSSTHCVDCGRIIYEQKRKTEQAMNETYCPFCHMLLAEHKQNEAQLCLYNLRSYVQQKNGDVK